MQHGYLRRFAPVDVLSERELSAIHQGALEILETCGANIRTRATQELLEEAGCRVDRDAGQVRIPPALAEECLRTGAVELPDRRARSRHGRAHRR